jgi:hypothetical protein
VKKPNSTRVWFVIASVIALAIPPLVLSAGPEGYDAVRTRVATMTQTERNRFERNSQEYLKLTEEQRAHYRAMHAELEQDRQENHGRLTQALDDYYAWLATLQTFPREELRMTTDPQQRITRISNVLEEQSQEQLRDLGYLRRMFERIPSLSSDQLRRAMAALERAVTLNQEQADRLNSRDGIERYLEFFKILRERELRFDQVLDRADNAALAAALPSGQLPDWSSAEDPAQQRRGFLSIVLFWNLMKEHQLEIRDRRPGDSDLEAFVKSWPEDRQAELDRLLELEPDQFRQSLERFYAAEHMQLDIDVVGQVMFGRDWPPRGPRDGRDRNREDERERGRGPNEGRGRDDESRDRRPLPGEDGPRPPGPPPGERSADPPPE